ncbi:MAG TPA: hypothetical protein VLB68_17275 [Pyrinomonadaceae bacterium]|nr:hypothetical protein [Pyrinomonadaceae bacterium]
MISGLDIQLASQRLTKATRKHVQRVLRYISDDDLDGLRVIRVIEECPGDDEAKRYHPYFAGYLINGHYQESDGKKPTEVVLYASDIYFGIPNWLVGSRIALLKIADTLAHEIGHHVFAKKLGKQPRIKAYQQNLRNPEEEGWADAYALAVIERMEKSWANRTGRLVTQALSSLLAKVALRKYWDENYQVSAKLNFQAYILNNKNQDAGQGYRHSMEKLKTQVPSTLSPEEHKWLMTKYEARPEQRTREQWLGQVSRKRSTKARKRRM